MLSNIESLAVRQYIVFGFIFLFIVVFAIVLSAAIQPARTWTLAMLGVVGAVLLSVANGGNDIANSMGVVTGKQPLVQTTSTTTNN